jgi:hypothetical protein
MEEKQVKAQSSIIFKDYSNYLESEIIYSLLC